MIGTPHCRRGPRDGTMMRASRDAVREPIPGQAIDPIEPTDQLTDDHCIDGPARAGRAEVRHGRGHGHDRTGVPRPEAIPARDASGRDRRPDWHGTRVRRPWRLPTELETEKPAGAVIRRLVLGSALMLFLELALIRWLGANVVHLSYFSNFVLLGSFLGIGLGFLISRKRWSVLPFTPVILALLVIFVFLEPVTIDRAGDEVIYFTSLSTQGPPAWLVLPIIFLLVAAVLAGPAEVVGRCFAHLRPLTAYRWDLVGSLIGIGVVHPAVVRPRPVGDLGHRRDDLLRGADRRLAALPRRGRGPGDDRGADGRVARRRHLAGRRTTRCSPRTGSSAAPR